MQKPKLTRALPLVAILAVVGLLLTGVVAIPSLPSLNVFRTTTTDRSGPSVLVSLTNLSEFRAASAYYETVVDIEKDTGFVPDFLSGERVLYVGKGDVDAVVDFSGLAEENITISEDRRSATIELPAPTVGEPVLDLETSYVVNRDKGLVDKFKGSDIEKEAQLTALEQMTEAATGEGLLIDRAKENTVAMLEGLLGALGYTEVTVTFAETDS